jgi:hypothetical protein
LTFHAAEQRSKGRKNDSAERSDFPKRPFFMSSTPQGGINYGTSRLRDQVNGCLFFWFVFFGQTKKMNLQENAEGKIFLHSIHFAVYMQGFLKILRLKAKKNSN